MNLNSVQFSINNRLFPLDPYNPKKNYDRPQVLNELAKSFNAIDMPLLSFGDGTGKNLDNYSNTFLISRELARNQYVYNLASADPSIRLGFSGTRNNVFRANTIVWNDRIAKIGPTGVMLIL